MISNPCTFARPDTRWIEIQGWDWEVEAETTYLALPSMNCGSGGAQEGAEQRCLLENALISSFAAFHPM